MTETVFMYQPQDFITHFTPKRKVKLIPFLQIKFILYIEVQSQQKRWEFHKLNAITRKYIPNPIKITDRIPMINSFRKNMSTPMPIKTAPAFAMGFQDLLESGLKY